MSLFICVEALGTLTNNSVYFSLLHHLIDASNPAKEPIICYSSGMFSLAEEILVNEWIICLTRISAVSVDSGLP